MLPEVPILHQGVNRPLGRLHEADRLRDSGAVLIEQGVAFHLAQFATDRFHFSGQVPGMGRHVQHHVHGRPGQRPVFLGLIRCSILLRDEHQFHGILAEQLRDPNAELFLGNLQAAAEMVSFRLRDAKLVRERIITLQMQPILQLFNIPSDLQHSVSHRSS